MPLRVRSGPTAVETPPTTGWSATTAYECRYATPVLADHVAGSSLGTPIGVNNVDHLQHHWLLRVKGQDVSGTVKGQFLTRENNAAVNARAQLRIRALSADFSTVRGTLLDFDTGALSSEFPVGFDANAFANRMFPRGGAQAITPVTTRDGDWLSIEIGFRAHSTATNPAGISKAHNPSGGDLPEDEVWTGGDGFRSGWIEFSQDIQLWLPAKPRVVRATAVHRAATI